MADNPTYDFVLNGLDLTANTTRIQLHKRNMNAYNHVLRQSTPTGARSGRSIFVVSAEMAFPNTNEINNKLRHLIAHFKVSPFAHISSRYISNAALSEVTESSNLAVTLSNLSVYTVPDLPESLFANFDMTLFNYLPYSPDFSFKNELTGPRIDEKNKYQKVIDPTQSNLYQKGFQRVLNAIPTITAANNDLTLAYNTYMRDTPPTAGHLSESEVAEIGKTLFSSNTSDTRIIGPSSKMHRNATGTFKHLARLYKRKYGVGMPVSNMFIPAGGIDFYTDETEDKAIMNEHMAGLAFDLILHSIGSATGITELKSKYYNDKRYKSFVAIAQDNSFTPNKDRPWHFSYTGELGKKNVEEIIRENHSIGSLISDKKNALDNEDYMRVYTDFLKQKRSTGYLPTNARNIWKIQASQTIVQGNDRLAVTSVNVSLTHNITSIPIVGHEYPTTQYMGGKHTKAIFALEGLRNDQIDNIKLALNTAHNNENEFKRIRDNNVLTIVNPITRLFGLEHCLTDNTESSTVPGNPDMDIFVFSVAQYDPWFTEGFSREDVMVNKQIKTKAFSLIDRYLEHGTMSKFIGQEAYADYGGTKKSWADIVVEGAQATFSPGTRTQGVKSKYGPHIKDYSPVLESHINNVVDILNDYIANEDVHSGYVDNMGSIYGLDKKVKDLISSKKPKIVAKRKPGAAGAGVAAMDYEPDDSINIAIPAKIYEKLSNEFWSMFGNGIFQLDQFKSVDKEINKLRTQSLTECYRDLNLPTTITNEPIDTDPDYYFWSEDNHTEYFNELLNDTKQYAEESLEIAMKMETVQKEWRPADVWSGESATNGHERPEEYGNSTKTDYFKINEKFVKSHDFSQTGLKGMLDTLVDQAHDDEIFTMNRAYPTYKVYFIEEDEDEEFHLIPRLSFDDFFGYNAVHDIKIIRSRKVPADLCILTMSNLNQKLTSVAKYNAGDDDKFYETRGTDKESLSENPIDALILRPGQKIQVRLGYSNDPRKLETVFNGQIVEVGGTHAVTIVCQSYATELVSQIKGVEEPEEIKKEPEKITGGLLAKIMQSPEVVHFGTRKKTAIANIILTGKEEIASAGNSLYGPNLDPRDDNIFPPSIELYLTDSNFFDWGGSAWDLNIAEGIKQGFKTAFWDGGLLVASAKITAGAATGGVVTAGLFMHGFATGMVERYVNLDYKIFHTTIWDIFKEMELRHPGWIASPTIYGDRMSMFFGVPDMGHWSRPETIEEYQKNSPLRKEVPGHSTAITLLNQNRRRDGISGIPVELDESAVNIRKSIVRDRFTPFRKHFYLADKINIISNDIKVNADVYNAVTVQYVDDVKEIDEYGNVNYKTGNTKTLKVDKDLRDENVNLLFSQQPNCEGEFMATRYAQGLLLRHLKDVYTGSITVLGNPKIKPYDVCHVFDDIADMYGPVEVEQVVHHFSSETGFITEIIPDLCVSGNEYATMALQQAMGEINYLKYLGAGALWSKLRFAGVKAAPHVIGAVLGTTPKGVVEKAVKGATETGILKGLIAGDKIKSAAKTGYIYSLYGKGKVVDLAETGLIKYWQGRDYIRSVGLGTATVDAYGAAKVGAKTKITATGSTLLNKVTDFKAKGGASLKLRGGFKGLLGVAYKTVGKRGIFAVGAFVLYGIGSVYIKETQERQPIIIKPLVVNKVPFVAGIEGFKHNTLWSAYSDRFGEAFDDVEDAWEDVKEGLAEVFSEVLE